MQTQEVSPPSKPHHDKVTEGSYPPKRDKSGKVPGQPSAAQAYLSKARYSPLVSTKESASRHSGHNRAPFGSGVPRFGFLGNTSSSALRRQPVTKNLLPSIMQPEKKQVDSVVGNHCTSGRKMWEGSYQSTGSANKKTTFSGRTDWTSKYVDS